MAFFLFLYTFNYFIHSAQVLLPLESLLCDTHLIYSYIMTLQHCVNLMELNTCVWNCLLFSFCVISLRLKQTNKQKTMPYSINQNVYDTLDTNGCSIHVLPMNE